MVNLFPHKEVWGQRERTRTRKIFLTWNFPTKPSPMDIWQFQVDRPQMSSYSCTAAAWEANKLSTMNLQRERIQNKACNACAKGNTWGWTHMNRCVIQLSLSCRKGCIVLRTTFRQEGKFNESNRLKEWRYLDFSFAEADGALR